MKMFAEKSCYIYSNKLKNWDERIWNYAWVNRIAIFLSKWAAIDDSIWIKNYKFNTYFISRNTISLYWNYEK